MTPTDYGYTGQREEAELGLYYYVARWYDPALARFTQADTIVPNPGSAKAYDRYAYVNNNPMRFVDPTGHCSMASMERGDCSAADNDFYSWTGVAFSNVFGTTILDEWKNFNTRALVQGGRALQKMGYDMQALGGCWFNCNDSQRRALQSYVQYSAGETNMNSNEIQASTVELAEVVGADAEDLITVLSGHEGWGVNWKTFKPSDNGPYTTYKALDFGADRMGMNETYADPLLDSDTNNQVHHIWYYIQLGYYYHGDLQIVPWGANIFHEYIEDTGGKSRPDYDAGVWGYTIGQELRDGMSLAELASAIRTDLGK